jgi:eukaryotic-like serine/threonine-protein kinase
MGSVWLGRRSDEKFEGNAAIRILDRRGLGKLAIAQIRHEANLLARLSHAHIARLFDAGVRENGQAYRDAGRFREAVAIFDQLPAMCRL